MGINKLNERRAKWDALIAGLRVHQKVLIAFSGGCDSAFLAAAARFALGKEQVLAVTAVSASLPAKERHAAERLAVFLDVPFQQIQTDEVQNPDYAANPSNRCFFCKDELFGRLEPLAHTRGMALADGFNVSDRSDYRPGYQAARTWNVVHPLEDAGLTKSDIRVLSRWRRLPTWNKPASPCLSSRIPYGTPVTERILSQIEHAEAVLHAEGFPITRVRHYGALARIEVPLNQMARLQEPPRWRRIVLELRLLGYQEVVIEARGFQSGRLNEALSFIV